MGLTALADDDVKGSETLTVLRGGGRDLDGDEQDGVEHQLQRCIVYRRDSTEVGDRANTVRTGFTVLADFGSDVTATDRIRWRGRVYDVDGEPAQWEHPATGWKAGCQFFIVRTEG